jgi:hypothetical protein
LFVGKHLIFAMKKILFLIALVLLSASAQAWWFGNYDDCVLDNMKAGLSTAGVYAVQKACRNKYPLEPAPDETATPKKEFDYSGAFPDKTSSISPPARKKYDYSGIWDWDK